MIIAVTYEDGQVFQHFGHTEQFKLYHIADGKVERSEVVNSDGAGHGALAGFLAARDVSALICGGVGGGARTALESAGIRLFGGVRGDADQAVADYLAGTLAFDPNCVCSHHDDAHGASCREHGHCGHHGDAAHGGCGHHDDAAHGGCGHHDDAPAKD